jgi:hypothetical protein
MHITAYRVADPDLHYFWKPDTDRQYSEQLDPDLQSKSKSKLSSFRCLKQSRERSQWSYLFQN